MKFLTEGRKEDVAAMVDAAGTPANGDEVQAIIDRAGVGRDFMFNDDAAMAYAASLLAEKLGLTGLFWHKPGLMTISQGASAERDSQDRPYLYRSATEGQSWRDAGIGARPVAIAQGEAGMLPTNLQNEWLDRHEGKDNQWEQAAIANRDARQDANAADSATSPQTDAELDADAADTGTPEDLSAYKMDTWPEVRQAIIDANEANEYQNLMRILEANRDLIIAERGEGPYNTLVAALQRAGVGTEPNPFLSMSEAEINRVASEKLAELIELLEKADIAEMLSSNIGRRLVEALTSADEQKMRDLYAELTFISEHPDLARNNRDMIATTLGRVPAEYTQPTPSSSTPSSDTDDETSTVGDDSDDDSTETSSDTPSGSLEAFADSGKGGLANDPDETDAIRELQTILNDLGFDAGAVDGKYGPNTRRAVREFQTMMGAAVDGDAGPETIAAIVKAKTIPGLKEFYDDLQEMARLADSASESGNTNEGLTNMRYLLSLVEGKLFEALSEEDQARFDELYEKHKAKFEATPEYTNALPDPVMDLFRKVTDFKRSGSSVDTTTENPPPSEEEIDNLAAVDKAKAIHDGLDGLGTDEEDVLAVLGSIRNEEELNAVEDAFITLYDTPMKEWLDSDTSDWFDSNDAQSQVDAIYDRILGDAERGEVNSDNPESIEDIANANQAADALYQAMKGNWSGWVPTFGLGTDEQTVIAVLGRISNNSWERVKSEYARAYNAELLQHISEEFSGNDLDNVNDALSRFGVTINGEGDWSEGSDTTTTSEPTTSTTSTSGEPPLEFQTVADVLVRLDDFEAGQQIKIGGQDAVIGGQAPNLFVANPDGRTPFGQPTTSSSSDSSSDSEAGETVEPRPASQGGRNRNQDRWDQRYGSTHNADGTPKER